VNELRKRLLQAVEAGTTMAVKKPEAAASSLHDMAFSEGVGYDEVLRKSKSCYAKPLSQMEKTVRRDSAPTRLSSDALQTRPQVLEHGPPNLDDEEDASGLGVAGTSMGEIAQQRAKERGEKEQTKRTEAKTKAGEEAAAAKQWAEEKEVKKKGDAQKAVARATVRLGVLPIAALGWINIFATCMLYPVHMPCHLVS
jgi:hypothetical protein